MQLSKSDELHEVQKMLWGSLGLDAAAKPAELQAADLGTCLAAARAICLTKGELQQMLCPADIHKPLNPRNEAAALALLTHKQSVCGGSSDRQQQLQALLAAYPSSTLAFTQQQQQQQEQQQQQQPARQPPASFSDDSPEQVLYRWALEQGATSQVTPALFPLSSSSSASDSTTAANNSSSSSSSVPSLRGCAAATDLEAGSAVMSIPVQLLITYNTAAESDFGKALSRLPGLDPETLAVIWTMVDRHEPESPHAPFWSALPAHFGTGLSAPHALVDVLKGVPLHLEVVTARAHVRQQFEALQQTFKVLLTAYSSYLQPRWFSEESYLWAVELWYAYAIQVKFPDSTIKPALVPLASLINHSAGPHIVHFSTVYPKTRSLELKSFRPVQQHEQVYLSYGPLPNSQLLLFYGFALPGNPYEQQQITVQPEQVLKLVQQQQEQQWQQQQEEQQSARGGLLAEKQTLIQQLQLPSGFMLTVQQPLPHGLLHSLRVLCADSTELQAVQQAMHQYKQQGSTAVPAARGASAQAPGSSKGTKSKGRAGAAASVRGSNSRISSNGCTSAEAVQQRWDAVAMQDAVLGAALSSTSEQLAAAVLSQLVADAKQPFEACLAKLHKRQQLQALLQQQQNKAVPPVESDFAAVLEVYLQGVLGLFEACQAAAPKAKSEA